MSAGGLEVGAIALWSLMEVDGVLAGRQIVKMKLEGDTFPLLPQDNVADGLALGIFEFDFGFGGARESGNQQNSGQGDEGKPKAVHARIIANFAGIPHQWAMPVPQAGRVYFDKV